MKHHPLSLRAHSRVSPANDAELRSALAPESEFAPTLERRDPFSTPCFLLALECCFSLLVKADLTSLPQHDPVKTEQNVMPCLSIANSKAQAMSESWTGMPLACLRPSFPRIP